MCYWTVCKKFGKFSLGLTNQSALKDGVYIGHLTEWLLAGALNKSNFISEIVQPIEIKRHKYFLDKAGIKKHNMLYILKL